MDQIVTFKIPSEMISTENSSIMENEYDNRLTDFFLIKKKVVAYGYNEMIDFVERNIRTILNYVTCKNQLATHILTSKEFLTAALMAKNLELEQDYIIKLNGFYRSYLVDHPFYYNDNTALLLSKFAGRTNIRLIKILMNFDYTPTDALWVVVNRYSSTDERRNIRRATRTLGLQDSRNMTEQRVVNILSTLFGGEMTTLFCAVMTDRFESFYDENEQAVYDTVSLALLRMIESMNLEDIEYILKVYINEVETSKLRGRFALKTIDRDAFCRTTSVLQKLCEEGYKFD